MTEQAIVERVAEAIKDAAVIVLDYSDVTYLEDPMVVARAAIKAMRPDASTMGLILNLAKKTGLDPSEIDIAVCFYLDAALKEPSASPASG